MGEAKRRRAAPPVDRIHVLGQEFAALGISPAAPGFYNSPAFLAAERKNPELLNAYAEWVTRRPRDAAYEGRAREVVPALAAAVGEWLDAEEMRGNCLNASTALSMFLERLGIWSFVAKGSVSVGDRRRPHLGVRSWHVVDEVDHVGGFAGHAWVCAPPFRVVDVTLKRQHWRDDASFGHLLPEPMVIENADAIQPTCEDVVAEAIRMHEARRTGRVNPNFHHLVVPHLRWFTATFGAWECELGDALVRYIPSSVTAADVPLEDLDSSTVLKIRPIQFWQETVLPRFSHLVDTCSPKRSDGHDPTSHA